MATILKSKKKKFFLIRRETYLYLAYTEQNIMGFEDFV